jgi:uncharacterized protein
MSAPGGSGITPERIISLLHLQPHPAEGGFFAETYRSPDPRPRSDLRPPPDRRRHSLSTAIYYLLTPDTFSALHRLAGDEIFHFYLGDPVEMLQLFPDGTGRVMTMGPDLPGGMRPQVVVPKGVWQGSSLVPGGRFALLGTTMAPGFEFADYEAGTREILQAAYPDFRERIRALTR